MRSVCLRQCYRPELIGRAMPVIWNDPMPIPTQYPIGVPGCQRSYAPDGLERSTEMKNPARVAHPGNGPRPGSLGSRSRSGGRNGGVAYWAWGRMPGQCCRTPEGNGACLISC